MSAGAVPPACAGVLRDSAGGRGFPPGHGAGLPDDGSGPPPPCGDAAARPPALGGPAGFPAASGFTSVIARSTPSSGARQRVNQKRDWSNGKLFEFLLGKSMGCSKGPLGADTDNDNTPLAFCALQNGGKNKRLRHKVHRHSTPDCDAGNFTQDTRPRGKGNALACTHPYPTRSAGHAFPVPPSPPLAGVHLRGRCGIPLRRRQRPCQLHPTRLPRRAGRRDRRGGQPAAGRQERHADGRDEDEKASIGRKTCRSR